MEEHRNKVRGLFFGGCLALIVLFIVWLSVMTAGFFGLLFSDSEVSEASLDEVVIQSATTSDKLAIIPIKGIILDDGAQTDGIASAVTIRRAIRTADADPNVRAIILDINSPGGSVVASALAHDVVADAQKPVIALYSGDVAASGAVYASVGADRIISHPDTLTGSIGVITEFYDISELLAKYGIKVTTVKSGEFKDIGSLSREMSDTEKQLIQGLIDQSYERFVVAVSEGRSLSAEVVRGFADGRVFTGSDAVGLGLVDELGDFDTAVLAAFKLAGIDSAKIIRYDEPFSISSLFSFFSAKFGKSDPLSVLTDMANQPTFRLSYILE